MRKLLIFVALSLIVIAVIGSQYTAYKQSKQKMDILQSAQDRLKWAEGIVTVEEALRMEPDGTVKGPVPVAVVPRSKIDELISNQQRLIQALEGQQNVK